MSVRRPSGRHPPKAVSGDNSELDWTVYSRRSTSRG